MSGSDENSGLSLSQAKRTIQAAVDETLYNATVRVYAGTYNTGGVFMNDTCTKSFAANGDLGIHGNGIRMPKKKTLKRFFKARICT